MVRSLDEAVTAARAHPNTALELWSEPGAASFVGAMAFKELITLAREQTAHPTLTGVLDCADDVAAALNAIRHRLDAIFVDAPANVQGKLMEMAAQNRVTWQETRPYG